MVSLSDSLVSSSSRQLPIRMRSDLSAKRQQYLGRTYWVVKEPIGLNYYRFQEEEFAILQMLDGETSLDEIKERFEAEFPPQKITVEELQQFLGMLHRSGLIVTGAFGQGNVLRKRRDERRRKELLGAMTNILCIRFKGFDPERFLNWLYPKLAFLFSPIVVAMCLMMWAAAATLVTVEFDVFQSKLPSFYTFFDSNNALLLALTLGCTKVIHEFGHGLTCKHFGGECHEMGVMILVLTPCLYCNVSDSWMLPNKWHRAMIGAAGIYIEVTLAAVCTFIWWFSTPGLLHNLCLNVVFISSVSTIIFNANPLLRYDGYYILSDVTEIPNLRQKATSILSRKLGLWCLGLEPPEDPFLPQRNQIFFALYTVAAGIYRWFIMASIMWFLYQIFKPAHLEIIGQAIIAMSLYGLVVVPIYKVGKFFYVPGRLDKVKKPRMYASLAILTTVVAAFVFVPLPYSVICPLEVKARDAEPVYVGIPEGGRIEEVYITPLQRVAQGEVLAVLSNIDLDLAIAKLAQIRDQLKIQHATLKMRGHLDETARYEIGVIRESLLSAEKQLADKQRDRQRLTMVAPIAGVVLPPPWRTEQTPPEGELARWSGTPLEPRNHGAFLEERDQLCQIGDSSKLDAILILDHTDVEFVREMLHDDLHPKIEIKLDQLPGDVFQSEIEEIGSEEIRAVSKRLSASSGGEVPTKPDPKTGTEEPQSASYQARAPLPDPNGLLRVGLIGRAKVHVAPQSLGERLWRFIRHTFSFRL